jgi:hypothetical protein
LATGSGVAPYGKRTKYTACDKQADDGAAPFRWTGENYLRTFQHRDLPAIMPDGIRVCDFHLWEKGIVDRADYVAFDVPLLRYLSQLEEIGENPADYESIWYYY